MSNTAKRVVSAILALFIALSAFVLIPPVSASALSQIRYAVGYSGTSVLLKFTPKKSTDKIYYTTDGSTPTKKSTRYKKIIGARSMAFVRAVEYNKSGQKVAAINIVIKPRVQKPEFTSKVSGKYTYVTITSATSGAKIYYTTDGSKPTKKSKLYTGTLKCKKGVVIRARAFKSKMNNSKVAKYTVTGKSTASSSSGSGGSQQQDTTVSQDSGSSSSGNDGGVTVEVEIDTQSGTIKVTDVTDNSGTGAEETVSQPAESDVDGVFRIMNEERAAVGVRALTMDPTLCRVAEMRAKELVTVFDHDRPDGRTCFTALDEYGVRYGAAGENIAAGQKNAAGVMNRWMNSPGHRGNILSSSFGKVGIGCYKSGSMKYWVQVFTD